MGIGAAFVFPATLAVLSNVFTDPRERAQAIGLWAGVSGVGVALGPVSGGWLLEHFWWGSSFFVNAPIVIVALAAGHLLVPTSRDTRAGRFDLLGLALSVAAVRPAIVDAASSAFIDGLSMGTLDAAGTAALGAVIALKFLPARSSDDPALASNAEPIPTDVQLMARV